MAVFHTLKQLLPSIMTLITSVPKTKNWLRKKHNRASKRRMISGHNAWKIHTDVCDEIRSLKIYESFFVTIVEMSELA